MRAKLTNINRRLMFTDLQHRFNKFSTLANRLNVNRRTLSDWREGISTIPIDKFVELVQLSRKKAYPHKKLPDNWRAKESGRKGGLAVMKKYGNIGTFEGRKKGGLASLVTHKKNKTAFNNIKILRKPKHTEKLAELIGVLFGDGHMSKYQVSVTTNSVTDKDHAIFVLKLIEQVFHDEPSVQTRKDELAVTIVLSSRIAVDYLSEFGMPRGNKIRGNFSIPPWIKNSVKYQKAFIRGLFDTDGCIYADRHVIRDRKYLNLGWAITSYSPKLRNDVVILLRHLGYSPTNRGKQTSIFLRKHKEIIKYFIDIKSNNKKHRDRFHKFIGEVPKWS